MEDAIRQNSKNCTNCGKRKVNLNMKGDSSFQLRGSSSEKQILFENLFYQVTALMIDMINLDYENVEGKK